MPQSYDIFLSYRRDGGDSTALFVKEALQKRQRSVFLDVTDLKRGFFDNALLTTIAETPNFIVILSANSLDRCVEEDDWLRKEIAQAIKTKRNIVPLLMPRFTFPAVLHPDIEDLRRYQGVDYSHAYSDSVVSRILELLDRPHRTTRKRLAAMAGIAIVTATLFWVSTAPAIQQFTAHPASVMAGDGVKLDWQAKGELLSVSPEVGLLPSKSGQKEVYPVKDTTYVLTAKGFLRSVSGSTTVRVSARRAHLVQSTPAAHIRLPETASKPASTNSYRTPSASLSTQPDNDNRELNGTWRGQYLRSLIDGDESITFMANLSFHGSTFTGQSYEFKVSGLRSGINGTLNGNSVRFIKTYETGLDQVRHMVTYSGTLDRASQTMRGTWTAEDAGKSETGTFMLRLSSVPFEIQ